MIHLRREAHVERCWIPVTMASWHLGHPSLWPTWATMGQQIYLDNVGHINLYIYIYYIYIESLVTERETN